VRICVIFNPVARGDKARHFRAWLDGIAHECTLKPTRCAGDARRLAAEAVMENFEVVVAAGGDGTVNEVLNGLGDVPDGFARTRLGVLPLGTVNVIARELKISPDITTAWATIQRGREFIVDVPFAEFAHQGKMVRRHFLQMAGAGLDARAIELVNWELKKKIGSLAYVVAGFRALFERKPKITVAAGVEKITGELVLFGNGRFYGGRFAIFPGAEYADGLLDACVLPRVNLWTLLCAAPVVLWRGRLPEKSVRRLRAASLTLASDLPAAFELDGEWVGHLPATFAIENHKLRVLVP
jgi:YegS/Rv2252/BmrU family lipid kinase